LRGHVKDYNDFNRPEPKETKTETELTESAQPTIPHVPLSYYDATEQAVKWLGNYPATKAQTRNATMAWMADECQLSNAKIRDWWIENNWPLLPTSPTTNKSQLAANNIKTYVKRGRELARDEQKS